MSLDGVAGFLEYEVRLKKVEMMREKGLSPWPEYKKNNILAKDLVAQIEKGLIDESTVFSLSGRLMIKRDHGKTYFGKLQDRSGFIQIYLKADNLGAAVFEQFVNFVDAGDTLWVSGFAFVTKTGEPTLKVKDFAIVSKALRPLPEKFHGITDLEMRYRQRYLDLIANSESKERFLIRSKVVAKIREFLLQKDFIEVETPMLHPIAGGAAAKPFKTHHNALDMELFLRIAPELYLKRLVVGGFERVFEINRSFRNEGISTRHNPEFTMLEFYMAYADYQDGISLVKEMFAHIISGLGEKKVFSFGDYEIDFGADFTVMTLDESLVKVGGFSESQLFDNIDDTLDKEDIFVRPDSSYGEKIYRLFEERVEKKLIQPTFITGFPIEVSPLAKKDPADPLRAARFELFVCGLEVSNGYTELNDPIDQAERFQQQVASKNKGDEEAHDYDHDYVLSLEHGLPPTAGVGIGIDRLVMLLTNTTSIKDVILFPTLRQKV